MAELAPDQIVTSAGRMNAVGGVQTFYQVDAAENQFWGMQVNKPTKPNEPSAYGFAVFMIPKGSETSRCVFYRACGQGTMQLLRDGRLVVSYHERTGDGSKIVAKTILEFQR